MGLGEGRQRLRFEGAPGGAVSDVMPSSPVGGNEAVIWPHRKGPLYLSSISG